MPESIKVKFIKFWKAERMLRRLEIGQCFIVLMMLVVSTNETSTNKKPDKI